MDKIYITKESSSYEERVEAGKKGIDLSVDVYRSQMKALVEQQENTSTAKDLIPFIVKGGGSLFVTTPNNYFAMSFEHLVAYNKNMNWGKNNLNIKFNDGSEVQGGFDKIGAFVCIIEPLTNLEGK